MTEAEIGRWSAHLRSLSAPVIATDDVRRGFVDEMDHRRAVDGAFLSWCGRAPEAGRVAGTCPELSTARAPLDVVLWEGAAYARGDGGRACNFLQDFAGKGAEALTSLRDFAGVEVWTETELSALHALSWLAVWSGRSADSARALDAAAWHVEHLQPDNATNHPWGLHVFLWLERERPGLGARLTAETLLSNCQVSLGRPDLLSAYILRDSAAWMEGFGACAFGSG